MGKQKDQLSIFDAEISSEWIGMPEFVQEKKEPFKQIIIRFETEDDFLDFQKVIGQKLTLLTKSIWHPFRSHWGDTENRWKDEK